jgi:hypothetical protein
VKIKNRGTEQLVISTIDITGAYSTDFAYLSGCTQPLAHQETCAITVTATAHGYGKRSADLLIQSNDLKKPIVAVRLKGKGK